METTSSLQREISPPRVAKRRRIHRESTSKGSSLALGLHLSTLAAVEAGKAKIDDHLAYFSEQLSQASKVTTDTTPRISVSDFANLYRRNQHENGNHFVIHQHNHPRAGVHYDLRLQFSKTSSLSFSIPKGVPGNPNSKSLGRMAIETRVHNLWNHLIESASATTGSLLIWDTGEYSILPRKMAHHKPQQPETTDEDSDLETPITVQTALDKRHENEKLIDAFQTRYIRLRLHGTRLPHNYTITMRLPSQNDVKTPVPGQRRRRKSRPNLHSQPHPRNSDSEAELEGEGRNVEAEEENMDTDSEEDLSTRTNNAYPGSTNSIGSVHQRQWFLLLDRRSSGFVQCKGGTWERSGVRKGEGFESFYVRGRDFERSVVTGRLAKDVESDEGVEGFVGRAGWMGITA